MFWILAAVLGIAALAFVLRPLLKPPVLDEHADKRRALRAAAAAGAIGEDELHERLLALPVEPAPQPTPVGVVMAMAVLVPALGFGLYLQVGSPEALDPAAQVAPPAPTTMEEAIAALEARLAAEPNDVEGWVLLGRSRRAQEDFAAAEAAMAKAYALAADNVEVQIDYAEAKALATPSRRFQGESLALLQQAYAREPGNARAAWLLGIAAMQDGRPADAAKLWEPILAQMPADAPARPALTRQINDARQQAGLAPLPEASAPTAAAATPSVESTGARIEVAVELAAELAAQVPADAVLFVFARAPEGPRAPLAIQRLSAASLPTTLVLDQSMGMIEGMNLGTFPEVVVGARISASGNASPQSGDLEGLSEPLPVSTGRARVVIDRVLP
ncbi:c-type cytochrome biogenesis protein CcmI/CycH [Aquimonas voraii]|uniref:Cytochrome c-type biogenesis protein CcmH n=1 Tax=Aquimonas voraii TaxID=265719 RepID=A0A1G6XR67_9GAMM|nr:tetratricopeptide repeat protein [Aquimonas voraii]SDD79915.1 cytochrome c-type biogenesis protein CcmH [Aquimonas voraii]